MLNCILKYKLFIISITFSVVFSSALLAINNDILNTHIIKTKKAVFNISYNQKYNQLNEYRDYYVFLVGVYLINTKSKNHLQSIKENIILDMPSYEKIAKTKAISTKEIKHLPFINTRAEHFLIFFKKNKDYNKREIKLKIQDQSATFNTEFYL